MEDKDKKQSFSAWIDQTNRIVSFQAEAGFEEVAFFTYDEMFTFVIEKSECGYRIQ